MIESKDKKELNEHIKAGRMMLDMMESLVEKLEGGGDSSDEEEKDEKDEAPHGKECENCGIAHGSDDEDKKIMEKVREVISGKGGMLSIIEASPAKERSAGQSMGIFLSRNMGRGSITNGMLNLVQQVFQQLTKDLPEEKKKGYKRMLIETLEDNL